MEKTRRLPIGVQSFEKMRKDGYVYVDKTRYIHALVCGSSQYFLSRPRRFGKSLFLSTLKAYWEGRKELFEGLEIMELEAGNPEAFQPYPVFYFDFNGENYQQDKALEQTLDKMLRKWEAIYDCKATGTLSERFQNLLQLACQKTGRRCVVLVDEYDKPLLEVLENDTGEEYNKAVFKGFFSTLKSYDEYLQFVFITGVTKFSKISIFSDLNQLNDISLNENSGDICGITKEEMLAVFEPEILGLAENQHMSREDCLAALKKHYDGYHFHPKAEGVYNPFSLLRALFEKEFGAYWFATGTPTFLVRRVKEFRLSASRFNERTIYSTESELTDYRYENPNPIPLLYQTGYLTIWGRDERTPRYILGFPNEEVKYGFFSSLLPVYAPASASTYGNDIFSLTDCLQAGDTDGVRDILTALFASIPYTTDDAPFEHYFQSVLYILFTLLGQYVRCEVHSSRGRADCILETDSYIYIFEFKLDKSAQEALSQIEAKGYALPYEADRRQLLKVGVSFDSGQRSLADWLVAE